MSRWKRKSHLGLGGFLGWDFFVNRDLKFSSKREEGPTTIKIP